MRIIKITTQNKIEFLDYPETQDIRQENNCLREYIGPKCQLIEHVMPKRLYTVLGQSNEPTHEKGSAVNMLIDEDGWYHDLPDNILASFLYETDLHGNPIKGDVLIAGEYMDEDGLSFSGLSEETIQSLLKLVAIAEDIPVMTYYRVFLTDKAKQLFSPVPEVDLSAGIGGYVIKLLGRKYDPESYTPDAITRRREEEQRWQELFRKN